MAGMKLSEFVGGFPIRDIRMLPDTAAAQAVNFRPLSGGLDGTRRKRFLRALTPGTRRVYRIPTGAISDIVNGSFWMQFSDPGTDVVRTPIVNDSYERYYWASPSTGLKFATKAQILSGNSGLDLGGQTPTVAPTVGITAGTGALDPTTGKNTAPVVTRSYLATFVDEFGSEGQPGPAFELSGPSDADWVLWNIPQPVTQSGKPIVTTVRIYRTVTGASGATTFFQVVDLATGTAVYTDRLPDTIVSGKHQLGSTNWAPPPPGLKGLSLMPGGIFVGWIGNTLAFSEPYQPHAWPVEYQITVQHPIIGLGIFGNTCVVLTQGHPCMVTGTTPASMSLNTSDIALPCLSRRSIVSMPEGVYYSSPQGLAIVSPAGIQIITDATIGRNIWEAAYGPDTIQAVHVYGSYTAVRTVGTTESGFMLSTGADQAQRGVVDLDGFVGGETRVGMDVWSGKPWLVTGDNLYEWMPVDTRREKYRWRSKEFQVPKPCNMGVAQLTFDPVDFTPDANEVLLRLRVWAGRRLVFNEDVSAREGKEIRLPTGFKSDIWQVEVEGALYVHSVTLASTIAELRQQ